MSPNQTISGLRISTTSEDPAAHILRFQHEDTEGREEHVADLSGVA